MDQPDMEKYRAAITEMLGNYAATPQVEVRNRLAPTVPVAHAWCTEIHRLAAASLKLIELGFRHETLILLRTAFEMTISLHWLAQKGPEGLDAVLSEGSRNAQTLVERLETSSFVVPEEVTQEVVKLPVNKTDEWQAFKNFEALCKSIDPKEDLYSVYRYLCGPAHASSAAAAYFLDRSKLPPGLLLTPITASAVTEATFAQLLIWAGRAFDSLVWGQPRKRYLQQKARELGLRQVLGYVQEKPPRAAKKAPAARAGQDSAKKKR